MRHRKRYDQSDIGAAIGLGVMIAPVVPDRFGWLVGAIMRLPVIMVAEFVGWAVVTTLLGGLK